MDPLVIVVAVVLAVFLLVQVQTHWRIGVFFIIAAGFLQDPFRKLVPGEPVAISATVGVVMLYVWSMGLGRFRREAQTMSIERHYPSLVRAALLYGGLVVFQAVLTIVNFNSFILAGIGLISYLGPLPAVMVGWWFCRAERDLLQLALAYVAFALVVAGSVWLSWSGAEWDLFRQVGEALVFYTDQGEHATHSGFMRVAEFAGWHMAVAACVVIVLATRRVTLARIAMGLLGLAALIFAIYLTGRRKGLAMIGLFVGIFIILLQFVRTKEARKTSMALLGLGAMVFSMLFYVREDAAGSVAFQSYGERGGSVFEDALERFYSLGIGSVGSAIGWVGFLGVGAGVVSQGGQHFSTIEGLGGAAEGGLGKIIVELGIPGLIFLAWAMTVFVATVRRVFKQAERSRAPAATLAVALTAFLLTNLILFVTASQVFGDPFVLILMGMAVGALLATPRLLRRGANIGAENVGLPDARVKVSATQLGAFRR